MSAINNDEASRIAAQLREVGFSIDDVPDSDLELFVQALHRLFVECPAGTHRFERNRILFGDHMQIEPRFSKYMRSLAKIQERIWAMPAPPGDSDSPVDAERAAAGKIRARLETELANITSSIFHGKEASVYVAQQDLVGNPELRKALPPLHMADFYFPATDPEMKPHQKLIMFYLCQLAKKQCRKIRNQNAVYMPTFTEAGHYTFHYHFHMDMDEWVFEMIFPYAQHQELYLWLTDRATTVKLVVNYLVNCKDTRFPFLERNRMLHSFANGVYDANQNRFYLYQVHDDWQYTTGMLSNEDVACNYVDKIFPYHFIEQYPDPLHIPTPASQQIMDSQEFPPDVCRWVYASLGRLIFPVGYMDNWQYVIYCKGVAGTGKSTLLQLASKFFAPRDVGTLMSEGSRTFSVEHLFGKWIFICYDADTKLTLSQTRFNSMVSGELISVERKFRCAKEVVWTAGGAFAGNTFPPWVPCAHAHDRPHAVARTLQPPRTHTTRLMNLATSRDVSSLSCLNTWSREWTPRCKPAATTRCHNFY